MTSGTLLPSGRCSAGTGPGSTSRPCCPGCPPTSGTGSRASPTGISPPPPSCSVTPQHAWRPPRRRPDDRGRPHARVVVHRQAGPSAPGQPAHHRVLPGHAPAAHVLHAGQNRDSPSGLDWDDLNEEAISAFLDHLETERHNGPRTRNLRLTAIRSLFRYAALRHPEHAAVIQRVLAIPAKRFSNATISFLTAKEAAALIDAPDQQRWEGRRDRALLMLALQTGLRVSELIGLDCADVVLG